MVCGIDEVGRGPLAGPVVAAAVVLDTGAEIKGLADSKRLSETRREMLDREIRAAALAFSLGRAEPSEIDALNILQATLLAMTRAVAGLGVRPHAALVDGNAIPPLTIPAEAIVRGDEKIPAISAASIVAKVARDAEMRELEARYPGYGFAAHKGYPTRKHLEAIARLGVLPVHRRSFAPVRKILDLA
jgi:ribonuclease HII